MGEMQVPNDKLYGCQTARSMKNFPIGGEADKMPRQIIQVTLLEFNGFRTKTVFVPKTDFVPETKLYENRFCTKTVFCTKSAFRTKAVELTLLFLPK
jgi:hypothetical protein